MRRLIVTDTTSDIPPEMAATLGIEMLPVMIQINDQWLHDRLELPADTFYKNFEDYRNLKTKPLPYEEYVLSFLSWANAYDEIIIIHCSSELSGIFEVGKQVSQDFKNQHNCRVEVIDSRLCGMGLGLTVMGIAEAFYQDHPMDRVLKLADRLIKQTMCYLAIPTLKYLRRSKRISGLKALVGSSLGIQPVVGFKDGRLAVVTKVVGKQKNIVLSMIDFMKTHIAGQPITAAVAYAKNEAVVPSLRQVLEATFDCRHIYTMQFGPSIAINTGPETIGVAYYIHEV